MKKGFPLIAEALAAFNRGPLTVHELSSEIDLGYISAMRLVNELSGSGLIRPKGFRQTGRPGGIPVLYAFNGGEGMMVGRAIFRRFLAIWNALQDPDSVKNLAVKLGMSQNSIRRTIDLLKAEKLVRIDGYERNRVALPTAIFVVGKGPDARRPKAYTNTEQCQRWYDRRKTRRVYARLSMINQQGI